MSASPLPQARPGPALCLTKPLAPQPHSPIIEGFGSGRALRIESVWQLLPEGTTSSLPAAPCVKPSSSAPLKTQI